MSKNLIDKTIDHTMADKTNLEDILAQNRQLLEQQERLLNKIEEQQSQVQSLRDWASQNLPRDSQKVINQDSSQIQTATKYGSFEDVDILFKQIELEKEEHIKKVDAEYTNLEKYASLLEDEITQLKTLVEQLENEREIRLTKWWLLKRFVKKALDQPRDVLEHLGLANVKILASALSKEKPVEIWDNFQMLLSDPKDLEEPHYESEIKRQFIKEQKEKLANFLDGKSSLTFPKIEQPLVSIIIVLFNRAELTLSCLESIEKTVKVPYEVIIIDNASSDRTRRLMRCIEGAKIVRNRKNKGFLLACNQAVNISEGKHLLFLNNDAQLQKGSLEAALSTMTSGKDIGAVGGKIKLLDGTLQEAGSIVWDDGTCMGYGRGQTPEKPEYMFRREVDYCSGVFLLTPKDIFLKMGRFDQAYAPAYYEETDYCMRLWQAGFQVLYEPLAEVIHFEFASSPGTEDVIRLQQQHRDVFVRKHRNNLVPQLQPSRANEIYARSRPSSRSQLRILFIEDKVPHVDEGAGFPRANQILHHLVELGHLVSVLPINFPDKDTWKDAYRDIPREVEILIGSGRHNFVEFLSSRPAFYDAVWICRPHNFEYFKKCQENIAPFLGRSKIIYDSEAIFSNRDLAYAHLINDENSALRFKKQLKDEISAARIADTVVAVNEAEAQQFREAIDVPTHVLNIVFSPDLTTTPFEQRAGILFVGNMDSEKSPNIDSIEWLVKEVYPHLTGRMNVPDLILVGSNASSVIKDLAQEFTFIKPIGRVDDLKPYFEQCKLFVAPTRYSAGSPLKVLQAAAFGLPVVCTELIRGQLDWKNGEAVLASSVRDAGSFAENIYDAYHNPQLCEKLRKNALHELKSRFALEEQKSILKNILTPSP